MATTETIGKKNAHQQEVGDNKTKSVEMRGWELFKCLKCVWVPEILCYVVSLYINCYWKDEQKFKGAWSKKKQTKKRVKQTEKIVSIMDVGGEVSHWGSGQRHGCDMYIYV